MFDLQVPDTVRPEDRIDISLNEEILGCSLSTYAAIWIKDPHKWLHSLRRVRIAPSGKVAPRNIVLRPVAIGFGHRPSPRLLLIRRCLWQLVRYTQTRPHLGGATKKRVVNCFGVHNSAAPTAKFGHAPHSCRWTISPRLPKADVP